MEEAVGERGTTFAAVHRRNEDCQAFISASRYASSVITKAKAWKATCSSLSPQSDPKSVYSLPSVAGFSSSFSSPNFSNCSFPRESASVFADNLKSYFSVSQPNTLRSRVKGYFFELRRSTCLEKSHSSFCTPLLC